VHGDVVAFTFLAALFAAGAVVTALLFPRRSRLAAAPAAGPARLRPDVLMEPLD
jgi:hypothetical protein